MHWKALALSVVVGGVIYLAMFAGSSPQAALAAALEVTWWSWLLILTLSLVNYGVRFWRWHGYLRNLGNRLPLVRHFTIYVAGFALTTTPGKAGEAIRGIYLRPLGVGYGRCFAVLYAERLLDLISVAILAALLLFAPHSDHQWLAGVAAGIAVALVLLLRPMVIDTVASALRGQPFRFLRSAALPALDAMRQASTLLRGSGLVYGIALGIVSWGAEAVAFYHVARVLDIPIGVLGAFGIYATAMLAGALSFIPGGLGSTEAVMVSLLALGGASLPDAVAATTVVRIATLWFAVALGVLALVVTEARHRAMQRQNTVADATGRRSESDAVTEKTS